MKTENFEGISGILRWRIKIDYDERSTDVEIKKLTR